MKISTIIKHPKLSWFSSKTLRWVILQDAAILIKVHGRSHCIFNIFEDIFQSEIFNDYADKLIQYMDEANDPNDISIENVLPGVLHKFDEQQDSLNHIKDEIKELKDDITRENIKADVSENIKDELKLFSKHIGNAFASYGSDDNRNNSNLDHAIVTQENNYEIEMDENDIPIITQETEPQVLQETSIIDSNDNNVQDDSKYSIPSKFDTVQEMIDHWDMCVIPRLSMHKSKWRKHLHQKDVKKFSRLKRVVDKINIMVKGGMSKEVVMDRFEKYYRENKKVFSKLTDVFVKNC